MNGQHVRTVWILTTLVSVGASGARTPPPAPGFATREAVMAAISSGKVKPINPLIMASDDIEITRNIEYGKGGKVPLFLDLYRSKKNDQPVPGVIFIHGGAWAKGSKEVYHYYCVKYAERGYAVATIKYRLSDVAPFPAAVQDAKCAVRWMRANAGRYKIDPDHIAVAGGSAGGHLAMMVGYTSDVAELEGDGGHAGVSSRVQAVVNLYGPTDLTTDFARQAGSVKKFLGGQSYEQAPKQYALASPITHLTKDDPPTLILHGTIDQIVPISQADLLEKKLEELQVPYVYDRLKGWPHTMDAAEPVNLRCRWFMDAFFEEHLRGKPKEKP
jgi:acetyl esterase/lipase